MIDIFFESELVIVSEPTKRSNHGLCVLFFKKCRHSCVRSYPNVFRSIRNNSWKCNSCFETSLSEKAKSQGLQYLGSSEKGSTFRKYCCENKHEIHIRHDNVLKGFECETCFYEKVKKDCEQFAELISLDFIKDKGRTKYPFKLNCGCEDYFEWFNVKLNMFSCKNHPSFLSKKSDVYLFEVKFQDKSFLKLGFSNNIENRKKTYSTKIIDLKVLKVLNFENGNLARNFEQNLHYKLKNLKLKEKFVSEIFDISGSTECYPVEILETILNLMNKEDEQ